MYVPARCPQNLSNTALGLFETDKEEFFLKYMAGRKAPRFPQTPAMCVGSSFDARTKSALYRDLKLGSDPQYEFEALFESQVEEHNRDFGRLAGEFVFQAYCFTGAYNELYRLLEKSKEAPRFEFTVSRVVGGVPILGKPDMKARFECSVVGDWKVKSFCSKHPASPTKNYRLCRDGFTPEKPNKKDAQPHKNFQPMDFHGLTINTTFLEEANPDYADQMSAYGWLMGEEVGDENVVFMMEEIVSKPLCVPDVDTKIPSIYPQLRVAHHAARVSAAWQHRLLERYQACWAACTTGYLFTEMSREESDNRCEALDAAAKEMKEDDFFTAITRSERF